MATIHTEATEVRQITVPLAHVLESVHLNPASFAAPDGTDSVTFTVQSVQPVVTDTDV